MTRLRQAIMELTFLLILFLPYWIRLSGSSPCSIMATATNDRNGRAYNLQLQLQCGASMCKPFTCNCVGDELNITCTGQQNCMKMKICSICDSPGDICVTPERLNSRSSCTRSDFKSTSIIQPSTTIALSDCTPVTITTYKLSSITMSDCVPTTLSQLSECAATTTIITESSFCPQCKMLSRIKTVLVTNTKVISKTLSASASMLYSCSKSVYDIQSRTNDSLSTANQTLPPALGALLGIVVMALAVTTTGWVWTYRTMRKKRGGMKITSNEQERTFKNPIYTCTEATETQQSSNGDKHHMTGVPTYATVSKPSKRTCGNKINQANIKTTNSQIHNYHQEPEDAENNYSLLGREESGEYNITKRSAMTNDDYEDPDEEGEGWGQAEENVYHVLEGPATIEGEGANTRRGYSV